ncbi:MAG: NAD-dependent epimerase/dehydratase family protein [Zhenhengia sp.]
MNNIYTKELEKFITDIDLVPLRNKSILITGATGLIGTYLIDVIMYNNKMKHYNTQVFAGVRNKIKGEAKFKSYEKNKLFQLVEVDIAQDFRFNFKSDYIIHAASNATPAAFNADPIGTIMANVNGTLNLLKYAEQVHTTNFVYISSSEVYGESVEGKVIFKEESLGVVNQMDPRSCYTESKRMAENICVNYYKQYEVKNSIARVCFAYGSTFSEEDNRVIPQFVRNALNGENIVLKSTGEVTRSYAYLYDVISGLFKVLFEGNPGEVYNISNKNSNVSIKEIAEIIAEIAKVQVVFDLPQEQKEKGYAPFKITLLDSTKLEKLGWKPVFDMKSGLENMIKILS